MADVFMLSAMAWMVYFVTGRGKRMKKRGLLFLIIGMVLLAGCSTVSDTITMPAGNTESEKAGNEKETAGSEKADSEKETAGSEHPDSKASDSAKTAGTDMETSSGREEAYEPKDSQYTWEEITITLPEDWGERCVIVENENGFSICQKASYEEDESLGFICGFQRTAQPVEDIGAETMIAYTDEGILYYLVQPLDVPYAAGNEEIAEEYMRMCQETLKVKTSIQIAASGIHYDAEEYVLPTSGILPVNKEILAHMSDNDLWVARNEIYARHGRQFHNEYLQKYFNQCTWYEGTVSAEDFEESVLSRTEKDNVKVLTAAEKEYDTQHPYPKKYQASETVREDLSGDGTADEIRYEVTEQENGELQCLLTVNGEVYNLNELTDWEAEISMTNPIIDSFYITDIFEQDDTLEIAVLDEGPSEDWVTYFFVYDGTLSCIGEVGGVPFADRNEGYNGFDGTGVITGWQRMDMIETTYLRGSWCYIRNRLIYQDLGWYDFLSVGEHALYEDLPVHCERDEASGTLMIPAQERVFFLGSDMEQWILVKGRDGTKGYMLVQDGTISELGKAANEVFSDLYFFD